MDTYKFTTVTNGSTEFQKNSGPLHTLEVSDTVDELDATRIIMRTHFGQEVIDLTVDTVLDNATTYGPGSAIHTVYRALNILFPKANSGTGGTGGTFTGTLQDISDGTSRFAMTTQQRDFLNGLMGVNNP